MVISRSFLGVCILFLEIHQDGDGTVPSYMPREFAFWDGTGPSLSGIPRAVSSLYHGVAPLETERDSITPVICRRSCAHTRPLPCVFDKALGRRTCPECLSLGVRACLPPAALWTLEQIRAVFLLCVPRICFNLPLSLFSPSVKGHLYAYIAFLEEPTAPTLPATTSATTTTNGKPASGRGGGGAEDSAGEEGGGGASTRTKSGRGEDYRLAGESCVILVSVEASSEQFQAFRRARIALETRFRSALGTNWDRYLGMGGETEREGILTKFCTQMQALHFYYCLRGRRGGAPCVTQCLSSPFVGPLADDADAQRVVWGCYTRAALRLRRGSCQEGRVFCGTGRGEWCLDEQRSSDAAGGGGAGGGGGGGGEGVRGEGGGGDQATALFESDPVHSLTYEIGPKVTVMSLFGRRSDGSGGGRWTSSSSSGRGDRDELHACFPSSVPPEVAYKAAVRLVAIVRRDRDWLFLTGTGAPK